MDTSELVRPGFGPFLTWLGQRKCKWFSMDAMTDTQTLIRTDIQSLVKEPGFADHVGKVTALQEIASQKQWITVTYMEAISKFLADGPKLFRPTQEQWDSMEHVELKMSASEFRAPFPAMSICIPHDSRLRLAKEWGIGLDVMPRQVFMRHRVVDGEHPFAFFMCRFGKYELFNLVRTTDEMTNIEDDLKLKMDVGTWQSDVHEMTTEEQEREYPCTIVMLRAAMNLCLMLTHYGHRIGGPVDPVAYAKHRSKRHLAHFKHLDYLTVEMKQNVVIRAPSIGGLQGPGTGIEVAPHWRRGHWRAFPGQAARRMAGEKVDLVFVRPCLVRPDRVVGDLSDTEVILHGS